MTVFEYDGRLLIVDCGVLFPEDHHPGVDLILPDFEAIRDRLDAVEALVLTHGHEDHIGATPYLLRERERHPARRLRAHPGAARLQAPRAPAQGDRAPRGARGRPAHASARSTSSSSRSTTRSPTRSRSRSAPAPAWCCTPATSRWTSCPLDGRITDLRAFARLGEEGVDLFLTDSTNAEVPGLHHAREVDIAPVLDRVFHTAQQRIIVACFASPRAPGAAGARRRRRPTTARSAYVGRSMVRNMAIARDLGYLNVPPGVLVDAKDLADLPPERQVLISTGSPGRAAVGAEPDRPAQPPLRAHRGGRHRHPRQLA